MPGPCPVSWLSPKFPPCSLVKLGKGSQLQPASTLVEGQTGHRNLWERVLNPLLGICKWGGPFQALCPTILFCRWGNKKPREVKGLASGHTAKELPCTQVSHQGGLSGLSGLEGSVFF